MNKKLTKEKINERLRKYKNKIANFKWWHKGASRSKYAVEIGGFRKANKVCSCGRKTDGTIFKDKIMCGYCFDKFVLEPYDLQNRFARFGKYR